MTERTSFYDLMGIAGAIFMEEEGWEFPQHFGSPDKEYQAAQENAVFFDLCSRSKVALSGRDAITFLQNLCTNDIKELQPGFGCETFLTTAKARIVAHGFVSRLQHDNEDVLMMDCAPGLADKVLHHLDYYLVSEQVVLENRTQDVALVHVCGPQTKSMLDKALNAPLPDLDPLQHAELPLGNTAPCRVRRNDYLGLAGYDLFFSHESVQSLWESLNQAGVMPAGMQVHEILRIEAGFPAQGKEIDEERLAMETGRTKQAISFTKGCYLGQETIVMARDRGHVNRTLMGLRIAGEEPVHPGRILHEDKEVGRITSATWSPRFGSIALAYMQRACQKPETEVEVETPEGRRRAIISTLPF